MPDPRLDRGLAHHRDGRLAEAEALYRAVLHDRPADPQALHFLGLIAQQRNRPAIARRLLRDAVRHGDDPLAAHNLAEIECVCGDAAAADRARRIALALDPGHPPALAALGHDLMRAAMMASSARWLSRRRAVADDDVGLPRQLANLAFDRGDFDTAAALYRAVVTRVPDDAAGWAGLLELAGLRGDRERRAEAVERLAGLIDGAVFDDWRLSAKLLYLDLFEDIGPDRRRRLTEGLIARLGPVAPRPPRRRGGGPVRLGYLSPHFGDHPIGHVTAALFAAHDRRRVTVHVYALKDRLGEAAPFARAIRADADRYRDLSALPADAAAAAIRADGVDVLIDLDGLMTYRGLEILARGAAALQLFWLGHAAMPALPVHDGMIADAVVAPDGPPAWRLPGCFHVASPHPIGPTPRRADCGLPEDGVVFCAFNNPHKVDADALADWRAILDAVPGAVLWLSDPFDDAALRGHLRAALGDRLVFAPRLPDKAAHLARHRLADLFLDSHRLNASTTALDALWAGLPLVTRAGHRFGERLAASFLAELGLRDWVAADRAGYVGRAVEWARDPALRTAQRERLRAALAASPLFDVAAFARKLEALMITRWEAQAP